MTMKIERLRKWLPVVATIILSTSLFSAAWASETTLIGEINDSYQVVADGQIYEIADTDKGNELAEMHMGAKAKVTGTVETSDGMMVINVASYEILDD
jgi:hypothetical protein